MSGEELDRLMDNIMTWSAVLLGVVLAGWYVFFDGPRTASIGAIFLPVIAVLWRER